MEVEAIKGFSAGALSAAFFFGALVMAFWGWLLYCSAESVDRETRDVCVVFTWILFILYCIIQTSLITIACVS